MRIRSFLCLLALPLLLTGCSTLYVNDPDLAKQTDAADTTVQSADALKPYTTELANIDSFSIAQDQAVATRDVAERDAFLLGHLAEDPKTLLVSLDTDACNQLKTLVGNDPCAAGNLAQFENQVSSWEQIQIQIADTLATVARDRQAWRANRGKNTDPDDCTAIVTATTPAGLDTNGATSFTGLQSDCKALTRFRATLPTVIVTDSAIAAATTAAHASTLATQPNAVDTKALQDAIAAAQAASTTGDAASLKTFQSTVEQLLRYATPAAQIAGIDQLKAGIVAQLQGVICGAPGATDTSCASLVATTTAGRAAAVWVGLNAVAQYFDADDKRYRSASWLTGANAILAAEKSDAQIRQDAAVSAAALATEKVRRLVAAAYSFARVDRIAKSGAAASHVPCSGASDTQCALLASLDARNGGLTPAHIIDYRRTLLIQRTIVLRQHAAQTEQQALTRAASASLKAYADGGIPASTIAQLLVDVGLVAAVAAK